MIETYHDKQHKIMIYSSANELKVSRDTYDKILRIQEEILNQMIIDIKEKSNIFSSEHIKDNVITLRKFQDKPSPSDQSSEKNKKN